VHEKFAFVTTWNDHEFANDCHQTVAPDASTGTTPVPRRRENANQAWAEYTPTGVPYKPEEGPLDEIRIYRSFAFGDLTERVMTDERLYHDGPPCCNELTARYLAPGCGEEGEEKPGRTMLGPSRRNGYFLENISSSGMPWKIWGNEVTLLPNSKIAA
jgi:alkaline phosphatase D